MSHREADHGIEMDRLHDNKHDPLNDVLVDLLHDDCCCCMGSPELQIDLRHGHSSRPPPINHPQKNIVKISASFLLRLGSFFGISTALLVYLITVFHEQMDPRDGKNYKPPRYCRPAWPLATVSQYANCFPAAYFFRSGILLCCICLGTSGFAMRHSFPFRIWVLLPISMFGLALTAAISVSEDKLLHTLAAFFFSACYATFQVGVSQAAFFFEREQRELRESALRESVGSDLSGAADWSGRMAAVVTDDETRSFVQTYRKSRDEAIAEQQKQCGGFKQNAFKHGLSPGGTWPYGLFAYPAFIAIVGLTLTVIGWSGLVDVKSAFMVSVACGEWSLVFSVFAFATQLSYIID